MIQKALTPLIVALAAYFLNAGQLQAQVAPEVRFVAAGIANARQQLHCGQVTVTRTRVESKEIAAFMRLLTGEATETKVDVNQETRETAQWRWQESKLSLLVNFDRFNPREIRRSERIVSDGRVATILTEYENPAHLEHGIYHRGTIAPAETVLKDGIYLFHAEFDPRFEAYYDHYNIAGQKPLDELFLQSKPPAVFKGEETLEGSRCMKIEIMNFGLGAPQGAPTHYWIDIEHGFLLRRQEEQSVVGQKLGQKALNWEVRVPRLIENNGVWLPAEVERKRTFNFDADKLRANEKRRIPLESYKFEGRIAFFPPNVERITFSEFKADCDLPPDAFILKWPVGTSVQDKFTQKTFKVEEEQIQGKNQAEGKPKP